MPVEFSDEPAFSQLAPGPSWELGIQQVLKPLDRHSKTPISPVSVWSQLSCPHSPEQGLRWTFGHVETPCLSGHCFHLSEPGQHHKQMGEAKVVAFAPAQLPGTHFYPWWAAHLERSPTISCQRWCSQIPTTWERPAIVPQIQVRGDSHFCA